MTAPVHMVGDQVIVDHLTAELEKAIKQRDDTDLARLEAVALLEDLDSEVAGLRLRIVELVGDA